MSEVFQYVSAVVSHGQALLTGGILIAILGALERKYNKPLSWKWFKRIIVTALFVASYMAWHEEHAAANRTAQVPAIRSAVVSAIQDLAAFQSERIQIENAANGSMESGTETAKLFLDRYSVRIQKIADGLPQSLSREGNELRQRVASGGSNSEFIKPLLDLLRSVSASL